MALIASLVVAWMLGVLVVMAFWPRENSVRADAMLIVPLGALVGLGTTSALFFAASLISARPALAAGSAEVLLAVGFAWRVSRRKRVEAAPPPPARPVSWLDWVLLTVFAQALVVAVVVGWRAYAAEPYGGWDAWAIWNLHARFMLRGGTAWPELLTLPQVSWTHPDYPWLIPASVARAWAWVGSDRPAAAALISAVFAGATLAILMAAITKLRGRTTALIVGLLLLGTPFFVTFAPNQHADIPLGAFMLATAVLVVSGKHHLLAGLCAGFAAWTKNEGLLFAFVVAVMIAFQLRRPAERRGIAVLLGGLAVALVPVAYFKFVLAPPNDLLASSLGPRLAQVIDGARHRLIFAAVVRDVRQFGEWTLLPYVAMALPFIAWRRREPLHGTGRMLVFVLGAMLAGFYGVYLLSPQDLGWHLETSLVRLLLQLWPLALFWWALAIPGFGQTQFAPTRQRFTWMVFVAVNSVAALGLTSAFSLQLAADELASARKGTAVVRVSLGDGWFDLERQGRMRWVWSKGDATLRIEARAVGPSVERCTLHFSIRSLARRDVTIRSGERVLWRGVVAEEFVPVALRDIELSSGGTAVELSTDVPGVPEAPNPGARALAFALYSVRLE